MDEVNSYVIIKGDQNGNWVMKLMDDGNPVQIPATAKQLTDEMVLQTGTIYSVYHMPDCRWYTESQT